jgi:phosphopentomutase
MKAILIVLDSVGIGEAPDAEAYGDVGSATLPQTARAVGGLNVPVLQRLGLGNITTLLDTGLPITGVPPTLEPEASFGAMREVSEGKDTITGHWEMAGLELNPGFALLPDGPPSFPADVIAALEKQTGRKVIGNLAASGTRIIEALGKEHMASGALIVYTSADSVMQIAAHEDVVPIEEQYAVCEAARRLCDPLRVGRVIARPFVGKPGDFTRTGNRRDFPLQTEEPTVLQRLQEAGIPVYSVGKIDDIFGHRGITESNHTPDNVSSQQAVEQFHADKQEGLIFANFIDFDMLYGHRRDPKGYAAALQQTDGWLEGFLPTLGPDDVLLLTADHGNDPTYIGTDHTREYVPLVVYRKGVAGESLGVREGFYDVAQSLASLFGLSPMPRGVSFL